MERISCHMRKEPLAMLQEKGGHFQPANDAGFLKDKGAVPGVQGGGVPSGR